MPLVLLNKPFRVLSQFTTDGDKATLADYVPIPDVYPAGRLDYDSEGLLLLTDDGALQAAIAEPRRKIEKGYWVQVEGAPSDEQLSELANGVALKDGLSRFLTVEKTEPPPGLWARHPPIRERQRIPVAWLAVALAEGRNRQVRRTTAAVGLPTLRLVRHRVGPWQLGALGPGEYRVVDTETAWRALKRWRARPGGRRESNAGRG